jgi:integrase/recombinase XerD
VPDVNDPNNDKSRLESRIEDLSDIPREDRQKLQFWLTNFRDSNADSTTLGYLGRLIKLQDELDVSISEATKYDWTSALARIEEERDWSSGTKRNWQKAVRAFLVEVDETPAEKDDIGLAEDDSGGKIDEDDILSLEEARTLIDEASNRLRDQAMFATLLDLGLRVAALCSLRVKDFNFEEGARVGEVSLNDEALGQKGSGGRTHVATTSSGHIRSYLRSEHPRPDDPEAPLFHKVGQHYDPDDPDDDGSISPPAFRRRMRRLAADTDIPERKLHPHNMKHSAVTIWALRGMSDREIEYRAGWARESGQLKRYEHLTGDDINTQILDTFGIETERETQTVSPIDNCPNCNVSIDTGMRYCPQCGQQIDMEMRPDWFDEYIETYGEDDGLATELLDNPTQIASRPEDLPESIRARHQDKIEEVVGYSLMGSVSPADSDTVPLSLPYENDDGERSVSVSFGTLTEHGDDLYLRRTDDGLLSVVTGDGDVVETVDPLGVE